MSSATNVRWIPSKGGAVVCGSSGATLSDAASKIPSRFGQLVALASLGKSQIEQNGKGSELVFRNWQSAFLGWLCLNLAEQKDDLDLYAEWLGVELSEVLGERYLADPDLLVPRDSTIAERLLFLSDTRALFALQGVRRHRKPGTPLSAKLARA